MNIVIHIYPKVAGAWSIISPIKDLGVPSHLIFFAGEQKTATTGTVIPGKLVEISSISREVNILENRGLEDKDFKGVGGIAKTSDFDITLSNYDNCINPFKLLDSTVKVCVLPDGTSSFNYSDTHCIFQGYIKTIPECNREIILTVADPVLRKLNEFVGTEIDTDKIVPINYGDFSNSSGKMAAVYKDGKIYVDSLPIEEVTNIHVYDDTLKEFYDYDSTLVTDTDNKTIDLVLPSDNIHLTEAMTNIVRLIVLYNPWSRAYLPKATVTGVAVGDVYSYTNSTTVNIKVLALKDGYIVFDDPYGHDNTVVQPLASDTLTRVTGSGTSSIPYSFRSEPIRPLLDYEADPYHTDYTDISKDIDEAGRNMSLFSPAQRCLIKVADEIIQICRQGTDVLGTNSAYQYTYYYCMRGVDNTTAVAHETTDACNIIKDDDSFSNEVLTDLYSKHKFVFSHTFKVIKASGMTYNSNAADWNPTNDPPYPYDSTVMKTTAPAGFAHGDLNLIGGPTPIEINSLSTISGARRDRSYFNFEIKFPKASLSAVITDMFFVGRAEFIFQPIGEYSQTLIARLDLLLGVGGQAVPVLGSGHVGWFLEDAPLNYVGEISSLPHYVTSFTPSESYPCLGLSRDVSGLYWGLPLSNRTLSIPGYTAIATEIRQTSGIGSGQTTVRQWFNNIIAGRTPLKALTLRPYSTILCNGLIGNLSDLANTKYYLMIQRDNTSSSSISDATIDQSIWLDNIGFHILFAVDLSDTPVFVSGKGRVTEALSNPINYPQEIMKDLLVREYAFPSVETYDCWSTWQTFDFNTTLSIDGPRRKLFDELESFCKKHCLVLSYDRLGKILLTSCLPEMANPPELSDVLPQLTLTDAVLLPEWSQSWTSVDGLIKKLTLRYGLRQVDGVYTESCDSADYVSEFDAQNETVLEQPFIQDSVAAEWLVEKLVDFYRRPIRVIKTKALCAYYQIGAWVSIQSNLIPNTTGRKYLLVATNDYLPVEQEPYTELTLLELYDSTIPVVSNFKPDIVESERSEIHETNSSHTIIES